MSKIRNRSVKTLPHELSNSLINSHRIVCEKTNEVNYFGENIRDVNITPPYVPLSKGITPKSFSTLSSGDIDSITLELNKLSGLSSSSSLSWSDEYESETTKKVQEELERMDRVLRGEEPIPGHYDKDEYEQWMNTFPNLSIFDRQITPTNSTQNITDFLEETEDKLVVYGNDPYSFLNYDTVNNNKRKKQSVIDNSEYFYERLLNQRSGNTARKRKFEESKNTHKNKNIFTVSHKPQSLDTDRYLRISSIKNHVNERRLSSKSLLNTEISKEYCDTLDFNSLPFIKVEELDFSKRNITSCVSQNRKYFNQKSRKKEGHIVLPPIVSTNQFRSVSATPRNNNKTILGFPVKPHNSQDRKSRKLSVNFLENAISNR